jgi:hypothetical protein
MSMHRIMFMATVAVLATATAHAEKSAAFYELNAEGEVQIAPDGHVSDFRIRNELTAPVAALVSKNVLAWHFDPILVDGKAVVAKTAMHLQLHAEPDAGKKDEFVVRIASIDFGTPTRSKDGTPPQYPRAAAGVRLGAKVVLSARLDENGKVIEAVPYQTSLGARTRNEKEADKWRRVFEKASIAAAKTWRYDLSETVGGRPIGNNVIIPIRYSIRTSASASSNRWSGYVPGPVHLAPWSMPDDEKRVAELGDEARSTNSRFHLKDDVIGKAL